MMYKRPRRIVVIDDDPVMTSIISGFLRAEGYEVHTTDSPEESLNLIAVHKPDLIILDRHLGKMDGTEVFIKIRVLKAGENIPILMLTGDARKEQVMKAINLGVNDYLAKPFVPQEFLDKVQNLINAKAE